MSRDEREKREDEIIEEYGEFIRGVCVYDMPDSQIYRISESIRNRRKRNTPKTPDVVEVEEPSTYYYNEYGQLCTINEMGIEEVIEC